MRRMSRRVLVGIVTGAAPSAGRVLTRRALVAVMFLVWALAPASTRAAHAASITLGVLSFDVFIPGDAGAPGVNAIYLLNLTGDPAQGGFALDPDFPSYTPVTLQNAALTFLLDGITQTTPLGDIGPGLLDPSGSLLFPDTASLSDLLFSATLSTTQFLLGDGSTFVAGSPVLSLALVPAGGSTLAPGDFALIDVASAPPVPNPVPEPGMLALMATGLSGLGARAWMRRRRRND